MPFILNYQNYFQQGMRGESKLYRSSSAGRSINLKWGKYIKNFTQMANAKTSFVAILIRKKKSQLRKNQDLISKCKYLGENGYQTFFKHLIWPKNAKSIGDHWKGNESAYVIDFFSIRQVYYIAVLPEHVLIPRFITQRLP